ncbi:MAG: hypothetical protein [Siphoviridae sp. cttb18]|nr:MAG: hypothetical protein [Siphoviridae sp. cttb18]
MQKVQLCIWCGKFRELDEHHTWSHWKDPRLMTFAQESPSAQKRVECEHCLQEIAKRKRKSKELSATRELYEGYAHPM